jgi:hypothetical protein
MLVISALFISCSKNKLERTFIKDDIILSGHEYKIWRFDNENHENYGTHFYFDNKYNCINLSLFNTGQFSKYQADDVVVDPIWCINGDTLFLQMIPRLIVKISKDNDTICIKHIGNGRINYLIDIGIPPKIK